MGNIFRLKDKPSCFEKTLKLIEASFHYQRPNSFAIDFAPLIDQSNHHNCFILIDEQENVLAHIGVKERFFTLGGEKFSVTMLGGIAVDEARRGEGHFQTLFQDVLAEKRDETALFLLWSDMEKLYNKYGFHLCGTQLELAIERKSSAFTKSKYHLLTDQEKSEIKKLYQDSFAKMYLTLDRTDEDWEQVGAIRSADLYINKRNGVITDYYFQNKGQDLPEIIFEYGTSNELTGFLKRISAFGKVWMGKELVASENIQYQFFMSPGDPKLFKSFIYAFSGKLISIQAVNVMKQEVYFDFNDETLALNMDEFLRGLFGPGAFEEIQAPAIFISGLDSI